MMRARSKWRLLDAALSGDRSARERMSATQRSELASIEQLQQLLRAGLEPKPSMPYLAERVIRRVTLRAPAMQLLYVELLRVFRPVVVTATLLLASMAAYNSTFKASYSATPTTTEVMLGLQPLTLTEALAADVPLAFPAAP